jgi:hypothetical protein
LRNLSCRNTDFAGTCAPSSKEVWVDRNGEVVEVVSACPRRIEEPSRRVIHCTQQAPILKQGYPLSHSRKDRSILGRGFSCGLFGPALRDHRVESVQPHRLDRAPATGTFRAPTIRLTSRLVFLDVTVLDKNRRPVVKGLTKDDFTITDDKKAQRIFSFEAPETHVVDANSTDTNPAATLM